MHGHGLGGMRVEVRLWMGRVVFGSGGVPDVWICRYVDT